MKDKKYGTQITVLAFAIFLVAGLVFVQHAFAQDDGGGSGGGAGDQVQDRDRIQDPTAHDGNEPDQDRDQLRDQDRDRIRIDLENVTVPVENAQQLQATIRNREQELSQEATSAAEEYREIIQNQNHIRLAIHAIYASEGLLGPVGPQVKQITEQINNSVQATVNAEAGIRARGVWAHIFFGGDSVNAQILQQEQDQNRLRIQELKKLVDEATITAEIRATLREQFRIMEEEQTRLEQIAEKESGQWGIFSWRFWGGLASFLTK